MPHKVTKLKNMKHVFLKKRNILLAIVFALVGSSILALSFASVPVSNLEVANGTLSGPASVANDTSASGNHAVQFGPASNIKLYTVPSTIASDCSQAVDSAINQWLATVPDGATAQFGVGKC